jgi:molybdopterin/thiamine biosynthesis adenylyltransferase
LLSGKVLVVGAGGLGAPLLMYLAAAGVGILGVVDDDVVDLSNLQRQVIHATSDIGSPKVKSAATTVAGVNPEVKFQPHHVRLTSENVYELIEGYDIIADGSDNFETRFLVNDACHFAGKTLVSGAILRFEGQVATFKSHIGGDYPCYRCLYREPPPAGMVPSCSEGGVLGALAGTIGSMQATEVLKEIMGIGNSLSGNLMLYDALETEFRKISLKRDRNCPLCGNHPTISDLSIHTAA